MKEPLLNTYRENGITETEDNLINSNFTLVNKNQLTLYM